VLRETFLHLPNVGVETERRLWSAGVTGWEDALARFDDLSFGSADRDACRATLERSSQALRDREHQFFATCLGLREAWRAFPDFRDDAVYLDIETDGGKGPNSITTIGMYSRHGVVSLVSGRDLDAFRDEISRYAMIVTFYGSGFDIPILKLRFPDVMFDQIHLDLCPTLRRVGVGGGLKRIEKEFRLARDDRAEGLTGWDAVKLWRSYRYNRDETALATLLAYNVADLVTLEPLAEIAYARLSALARGEVHSSSLATV